MTEITATDLRFTSDEASAFLSQSMGLDLTADNVEVLEARTEGWVAGLQLAALSMQGRDDVSGFIQAFAGDDRYVLDYLVEEVLQRQPERIRNFLLQTSILNRLSGPLCDATTDLEDGKAILESLERSNLFLIPLDGRRQWYRYHHLFGDVLLSHLTQQQPDQIPVLHHRASEWYERNNLPVDAIHHSLDAQDFDRAADLIELEWAVMDGSYQLPTWILWAEELPNEVISTRPVLSVGYAWAVLARGDMEAAESPLKDAERWLNIIADTDARPVGMVVKDEDQFQSLPASIASARAYLALAIGDVNGMEKYAQLALDLLADNDHSRRGVAASILGLVYWTTARLDSAQKALTEGMTNFRKAGNIVFAISATYGIADIRMSQGRVNEAARTYERSLKLSLEQGEPVVRGTTDLYFGLSEIRHEQGDIEAAQVNLQKSEELGEQAALPDWPYRNRIAYALREKSKGNLDKALSLLDEAERLFVRSPVPDVRPIPAIRARVWAAQGRLDEALSWASEHGLSVNDDLSYLSEFEHITLARILIACHRNARNEGAIHEATDLLERLLEVAHQGGRMGSAIEIMLLQSCALEAQDDLPAGLKTLERALTLAEPEGYVRIFVDEGEPMRKLLRHAAEEGIGGAYTGRLLSVLDEWAPLLTSDAKTNVTGLVDPLTEREIGILRLIASGMTNQEIAEQLFVSVSTIKTHINRTYRKLDVHSRTQAVARIQQLGIV